MPLRSFFLVETKGVLRYTKRDPKNGGKFPSALISCHKKLRNESDIVDDYGHLIWTIIGSQPMDELTLHGIATMCFPYIFLVVKVIP